MRTHSTSCQTRHRIESAFVGADPRPLEPRSASIHLLNPSTIPGKHRSVARNEPMSSTPRNETAELVADIDGLPVVVRLLFKDMPAKMQSDFASNGADIHSLLSITLEKIVDRMRGSSLRSDVPSKHPPAIVDLISETVLRVGPLELDLLDRTAKRGERQIDLRPREFRLLKYMMQRNDKLLTRASLLKDVWHYKFVPETNLVDVHMGRLRRKIDGPNDAPMIRNVRGVGFVLSATPLSQGSSQGPAERSGDQVADKASRLAERAAQ
jgi:DNA-binding winged helix-turn-helix (wHTH) protein